MDTWEIIGVRKFEYTSKKTGVKHNSCNLYAFCKRAGIDGYFCKEFFILDSDSVIPADLTLGSHVILLYNEYGNIAAVRLVGNK